MKIIFVCTGKTCRSPMAQGLFKKMLDDNNIKNVEVISAGLYADDGNFATYEAKKAVKKFGVDISSHMSHNLTRADIRTADLIVCINTTHYEALRAIIEEHKLCLLGSGISDPYGQSQEVYNSCAEEINEALKDLLEKVKSEIEK